MLDTTPNEVRSELATTTSSATARHLDSRSLFDGEREIRIDHDGQEYRLRQTRNGKLLLTK